MTWPQLYDPFGNRLLSTAVAALPVLTLFFVLVALKKRVWVSALCGLLVAVTLALTVFHMPAVLVATAAGHGVVFGLLHSLVTRRRGEFPFGPALALGCVVILLSAPELRL